MSNNHKKETNERGKPSRKEIAIVLQPIAEQSARAYMGLCDLTDLLIGKGVITLEELQAFIAKRHAPKVDAGTIAQVQDAAIPEPEVIPEEERETVLSQASLDAQEESDAAARLDQARQELVDSCNTPSS